MFELFNPFSNKPWFSCAFSTSLLKTLWEKEKLLVMSNSPFPTVFSTLLENFLSFSSNLKLLSANSVCLKGSKICCLEMSLLHKGSWLQEFLVDTKQICRAVTMFSSYTNTGFTLSIAIVVKCNQKMNVTQDFFFIWRKCVATTFCQVT